MKESAYKSYDELPLFLNAETVAKVLGVSPSSGYGLMHVVVTNSVSLAPPQAAGLAHFAAPPLPTNALRLRGALLGRKAHQLCWWAPLVCFSKKLRAKRVNKFPCSSYAIVISTIQQTKPGVYSLSIDNPSENSESNFL